MNVWPRRMAGIAAVRNDNPKGKPCPNAHCHKAYMLMAVIRIGSQGYSPFNPRRHRARASLSSLARKLDTKLKTNGLSRSICRLNRLCPC